MVTKLKRSKQQPKSDKSNTIEKVQQPSRLKFRRLQEILQKETSSCQNDIDLTESLDNSLKNDSTSLHNSVESGVVEDDEEKPPLPSFNELGNWHDFSCHTSDEEDVTGAGAVDGSYLHSKQNMNSNERKVKVFHTEIKNDEKDYTKEVADVRNGDCSNSLEDPSLAIESTSLSCSKPKRKRVNVSASSIIENEVSNSTLIEVSLKEKSNEVIEIYDEENDIVDEKGENLNICSDRVEAKILSAVKPKQRGYKKRSIKVKVLNKMESPSFEDFSISDSKRLADLERDLKLQQSRKSSKVHNQNNQFNKMLKLAQNDKERERIMIARVTAWESSIAWHENKRIEAVRALKKHRKELMKIEAEKAYKRKSKTHEFLDIDDENVEDVIYPLQTVSSIERATFARRALFAFAPTFQPTLTQMKFGSGGDNQPDDGFQLLNKPRTVVQIEEVLRDDSYSNGNEELCEICDSSRDGNRDNVSIEPSSDNEFRDVEDLCNKPERPTLWEASQRPIEIEEIVSAAVSKMEHEGLSQLLTLFNEAPPSLETDEGESCSVSDSSVLLSQLTQHGAENVSDIETSLRSNPAKFDAIMDVCPNWKEHVMYANLRTDISGIQGALSSVRDSLSNLRMVRNKILGAWKKQECVLELYEMALERGISRLRRNSSEQIANSSVIEIIDESDETKLFEQSTLDDPYEPVINEKDHDLEVSSQGSNLDDSLLEPGPFSSQQCLKTNNNEVRDNLNERENLSDNQESTNQRTRGAKGVQIDDKTITEVLKKSSLREAFLRRETVPFEDILNTISKSGKQVTKKRLMKYLDDQGIPFAMAWRQKS